MAKPTPVKDLHPGLSFIEAAQCVLPVRVADMFVYETAIRDPSDERALHDMRIAAKRLRYSMEFFRTCYPKDFRRLMSAVEEIQELSGLVHDCDVQIPELRRELKRLDKRRRRDLLRTVEVPPGADIDVADRRSRLDRHFRKDERVGIAALILHLAELRQRRYEEFLAYWDSLRPAEFRQHLLEAIAHPLTSESVEPTQSAAEPASNGDSAADE